MDGPLPAATPLVRPFAWPDWSALWTLHAQHLAELGIVVADPVPVFDPHLPYDETNRKFYEMDFMRIDQAYLAARGGFWLAWIDQQPVGHVGAQDRGEYIELRRMYVGAAYRRRGIGALLVRALIAHCAQRGAGPIRLWTADDGPGRRLYARLGFRQVALNEDEARHPYAVRGEIRMCLDLPVNPYSLD